MKKLVGVVAVAVALMVWGGVAYGDDPPTVPNFVGAPGRDVCMSHANGTTDCLPANWAAACSLGRILAGVMPAASPTLVTRLQRGGGRKVRLLVEVGNTDGTCYPVGTLMRKVQGVDADFRAVKTGSSRQRDFIQYRFDLRPKWDSLYYVAIDGLRVSSYLLVQPFTSRW